MTLHKPLWAQNETYSAMNDRHLLAAVFGDEGGVISGMRVTQRGAGANMTVDVAAGRVVMPGPLGPYVGYSDAVENRTIGAAPAIGTSRRDLVYAEVVDPQAMGSGADVVWDIKVEPGVAAASNPALPATPSWSVALAEVLVTSSTTSVLTSAITNIGGPSILGFDLAVGPNEEAVDDTGVYEQILTKSLTVVSPVVAAIQISAGLQSAANAGSYDWRGRIQVDNLDHPIDAQVGILDGWINAFGGGLGYGSVNETIFWPLAAGTHVIDFDFQVAAASANYVWVTGSKIKCYMLGSFGPS